MYQLPPEILKDRLKKALPTLEFLTYTLGEKSYALLDLKLGTTHVFIDVTESELLKIFDWEGRGVPLLVRKVKESNLQDQEQEIALTGIPPELPPPPEYAGAFYRLSSLPEGTYWVRSQEMDHREWKHLLERRSFGWMTSYIYLNWINPNQDLVWITVTYMKKAT